MENTDPIEQNEIESQKKRGFWGWTIILIRWLFILLFAVILLGGLYFKAPWKVLVLDALLLALLTVVPKKKRKYGWLALAAAVLAVTVWVFIPEKDTGNWRPYTFDAEIKAFNDKYAVPDAENAALMYNKLCEKIRRTCQIDDPADEKDYMDFLEEIDEDQVKDWLQANSDEVFNLLSMTSQKNKCFWTMGSDGTVFNYPNINILKHVMRFMDDQILLDIQEGKIEKAIDKISWGLNLARHLKEQPDKMHWLVGTAIEAMYHRPLWELIVTANLSQDKLIALSGLLRLNVHNWNDILHRNTEYVAIMNKTKFVSALYEINSKEHIRYSGTIMGIGISLLDNWFICSDLGLPDTDYWPQREKRIGRFLNWWFVPKHPNDLVAMFDNYSYCYSFPDGESQDQAICSTIRWNAVRFNCDYLVKLNVLLSMTGKSKMYQINQRVYSEQLASCILLALKQYHNQYNQWPASLELLTAMKPGLQLTDPLNDNRYVYQLTDDGFILYSKGLNGIDEGGQYGKNADDWLFWPDELEIDG